MIHFVIMGSVLTASVFCAAAVAVYRAGEYMED